MNETPMMLASNYGSNAFTLDQLAIGATQVPSMGIHELLNLQNKAAPPFAPQQETHMSGLRVVRVYIADTNEAIPMEKRILHTGDEKLTEFTDQELFFEVPISDLLSKHNEYRKTVVDKKASEKFGRDVMLEPVRIKDLKMVVVTIAQF